jgi:hypothetical protein
MTPVCEVCGQLLPSYYCTNSRCQECHRTYCTPGGNTDPGHGRGWPPTKEPTP